MKLQDVHARSLNTATAIYGYFVERFITPREVIQVLNEAHVPFVLVGAYGLSGWTQKPRATEDVEVLVAARSHKKAIRALLAAFPQLEEYDLPVVTRLRDRDTKQVAIEVMKPNQPPHREVFKHTHAVSDGGQTYRIPSLEMALVMKFAPMISSSRDDVAKYQDAHDFGRMVQANPKIDLDKLAELGDLVHPGGGQEVVEIVRKVRAGEKLLL
jgi:hypothetical protein